MLLILRERNGDLEVPLGIIINVAEEIEIKACVIEARKRIRRRIERLLLLLMLLRPFLQYADGPSSRPWKLEGVKVGSWNLERLERVMMREGELAGKKRRGRPLIMLGANDIYTPLV